MVNAFNWIFDSWLYTYRGRGVMAFGFSLRTIATPVPIRYSEPTELTDAVLIVEDKKFHVLKVVSKAYFFSTVCQGKIEFNSPAEYPFG